MTSARAYPRLPASAALTILGQMREIVSEDPSRLTELVAFEHLRAEAVPTGAIRATTEDIVRVREHVTEQLATWLVGRPVGRDATVSFDIALGRSLHESLGILPADAAHDETWNFLSAVVFPDVVWTRFPDLHPDRLLGKRHRNTLRRAWFRYDVIGDLQSSARLPLGEDEMTGLFERSQLARDRNLVRTLATMVLEADAPNRSQFARELLKGVTALTGTYLLDGLAADELTTRLEMIAAGPRQTARHRAEKESGRPSHAAEGAGDVPVRRPPSTPQEQARPAPPEQLRRRSVDRSDLVQLFHNEMLDLCGRIEGETGMRPTVLRAMIGRMGGVEAARTIVGAPHPSDTFTTLMLEGRTDLTVETLVLDEDFRGLFTSGLLERAAARLGRS